MVKIFDKDAIIMMNASCFRVGSQSSKECENLNVNLVLHDEKLHRTHFLQVVSESLHCASESKIV
jgi:hypothetical protein